MDLGHVASVCERGAAPARLSGKCLGSPLRCPARAEGRAGSTDPSHPDPSACSSRTWNREPSADPRPCPARPLPESAPAASCVKRGAAAPRESSQERRVTRGVCDSVPPPPLGPTWTRLLTREGPAEWVAKSGRWTGQGPARFHREQRQLPWGAQPHPSTWSIALAWRDLEFQGVPRKPA